LWPQQGVARLDDEAVQGPVEDQTSASAADRAEARIVDRLATEHFLRSARAVSDQAGGNLFNGLTLRAIVAANIGNIDQKPKTPARPAALSQAPPHDQLRPVSVLAIAGSLGLPYETTRRHVAALMKQGACMRVRGGIVASPETLAGPEAEQAMLANLVNLRRFLRALRRAGIALD
jgi:hypothetical protein